MLQAVSGTTAATYKLMAPHWISWLCWSNYKCKFYWLPHPGMRYLQALPELVEYYETRAYIRLSQMKVESFNQFNWKSGTTGHIWEGCNHLQSDGVPFISNTSKLKPEDGMTFTDIFSKYKNIHQLSFHDNSLCPVAKFCNLSQVLVSFLCLQLTFSKEHSIDMERLTYLPTLGT